MDKGKGEGGCPGPTRVRHCKFYANSLTLQSKPTNMNHSWQLLSSTPTNVYFINEHYSLPSLATASKYNETGWEPAMVRSYFKNR